jgi:hypothetical protein
MLDHEIIEIINDDDDEVYRNFQQKKQRIFYIVSWFSLVVLFQICTAHK